MPFRLSVFRLSCAAVLLALAALPATAQAPDSTAVRARPQGTLVKLGTGIVPPAFEFGGYSGLSVPLVLGVEHHLSPSVSVYANGFSGVRLINRRFFDYREPVIGYYGFDAGIRYYYNQEKRRQRNRATGPFVGNYLALQTTSTFRASPYSNDYRYSGLTAVWGMQRRLGKYGWLDAYAGAGVGRDSDYYYNPTFGGSRYGILLELGIKLSLGSRLTH